METDINLMSLQKHNRPIIHTNKSLADGSLSTVDVYAGVYGTVTYCTAFGHGILNSMKRLKLRRYDVD